MKPYRLPASWVNALQRLRTPVRRTYTRATTAWRSLSSREQTQLQGLLLIVLIACAYLFVLAPALKNIRYWQAELPRLQSQAQELQRLLKQAPGAPLANSSPPAAITESLQLHPGLPPYQISYTSPLLTLEFTPTPNPDPLLAWLNQAPSSLGWHTQEVLLQRSDDEGTPTVRVTLTLKETIGK